MKKLLLTFAMCAITISAFAQAEIVVDKVNSDGSRFIGTNYINCRTGMTDRHPMLFSVCCYSEGDNIAYSIEVAFPNMSSFKIPQGGLMLIKLADDTVIELHNATPTEDTQDIIGEYNTVSNMRTYTMHAAYDITSEQMEQIANSTVKKIRIETLTNTFDVNYKKDKVAAALSAQYWLVARTAQQQKDLKSDF